MSKNKINNLFSNYRVSRKAYISKAVLPIVVIVGVIIGIAAVFGLFQMFSGNVNLAGFAGYSGTGGTEITSCGDTITVPGEYYLSGDLICNSYALIVQTEGVLIDCQDNSIVGPGIHSGIYGAIGINLQSPTQDTGEPIEIYNCNVGGFNYGINIQGAEFVIVEDSSFSNNNYAGVRVSGSSEIEFRRNEVSDNQQAGFKNVDGETMYVEDNVMCDNGIFDISCSSITSGAWSSMTGNYWDSVNSNCQSSTDFEGAEGSCSEVPEDYDGDGYYSTIDCDDSDASVWQEAMIYPDADGDGYGIMGGYFECVGELEGSGYADNDDDCEDSDASVWQESILYTDADGDGYGEDGTEDTYCIGDTIDSGYADNGGDCDDSDSSLSEITDWYTDSDLDGYGSSVDEGVFFCVDPTEEGGEIYVDNNYDCNDGDSEINLDATEICVDEVDNDCDSEVDSDDSSCVIDLTCMDSDGGVDVYTAGQIDLGNSYYDGSDVSGIWEDSCITEGGSEIVEYSCSDGTETFEGHSVPSGYAFGQVTKCDGDDVCTEGVCFNSKDLDNDGVDDDSDNCPDVANPSQDDNDGDGIGDTCDSDADGDGSDDETEDCDMTDSNYWQEVTAYTDSDGDGYGDLDTETTLCVGDTIDTGYVTDGSDCDDTDSSVYQGLALYVDADGDGYGKKSISSSLVCVGSDYSGYVDNGDDCDDNDASVGEESTWYTDNDGDGYGSATATSLSCTQPSGYVDNALDCGDFDIGLSPDVTETCDTIDNNCDGQIDEGDVCGVEADSCDLPYSDLDGSGSLSSTDLSVLLYALDAASDSSCGGSSESICDYSSLGLYICDDGENNLLDSSLGSGSSCSGVSCSYSYGDLDGSGSLSSTDLSVLLYALDAASDSSCGGSGESICDYSSLGLYICDNGENNLIDSSVGASYTCS